MRKKATSSGFCRQDSTRPGGSVGDRLPLLLRLERGPGYVCRPVWFALLCSFEVMHRYLYPVAVIYETCPHTLPPCAQQSAAGSARARSMCHKPHYKAPGGRTWRARLALVRDFAGSTEEKFGYLNNISGTVSRLPRRLIRELFTHARNQDRTTVCLGPFLP